jgi:diguanylate cyclase (GGDEF)-like protein
VRLPNSLHARIGLFCLALFLVVQIPTLWLAFRGNNEVAALQLKADLNDGTRTFRRLIDERGAQLELATRVLATDFAFRKALATGDPATVQSALENHAARLRADFGLVLSTQRAVVASTGASNASSPKLLAAIAPADDDSGGRSFIVSLDRRLVQLAVVPVLAPDPVGWVAVGYEIDQRMGNDLKQLAGLDVSFVSIADDGSAWLTASTLPRALHDSVTRYATNAKRDSEGIDVTANSADQTESHTLEADGDSYATSGFALDERKPPRAVVFTHRSVAQANAPFKRLTDLLMILSVLGIVGCALGSSLLAGAIARPIRSLTAMTDSGAHVGGKLTGELQGLANSFNKLVDTLRTRDAEILHLAYFDSLTGLRNRVGFVKIASEFVGGLQSDQHAVIALIEIASSTQITGVLGHEVGDEVIRVAAAKLLAALPAPRIAGRLGTDEFAVMLVNANEGDTHRHLQQLIAQFEQPLFAVSQSIDVRINVGWAQLPEDVALKLR